MLKENEEKGTKNRVVVFDVKQDDNILKQVHCAALCLLLNVHAGPYACSARRARARLWRYCRYGAYRENGREHPADLYYPPWYFDQQRFARRKLTRLVAGLQIPTCRANPLLGARVNVLGTLNVFEAARIFKEKHVRHPLPCDRDVTAPSRVA